MEKLEKVYRMLENELDLIANRGELSNSSLESVYKLSCAMKNLKKIMDMDGYSQRGRSSERGRSSYDSYDSYRGGSSYREGGSSYNDYGSMRGYSSAPMREHLEMAMRDATDERMRQGIRKLLEQM